MSDLLKKIKVKDGVADKFLSVDANGNMISTNYGNSDMENMTNRLQTLEGVANSISEKIVEINGETV